MASEKHWKTHLQSLCEEWADMETDFFSKVEERDRRIFLRKKDLLKERNAKIVKAKAFATPIRSTRNQNGCSIIDYYLQVQLLIKQKDHLFVEEYAENRQAGIADNGILFDHDSAGLIDTERQNNDETPLRITPVKQADFRRYNRLDAVKYAERYWQNPNKHFKTFDVDCTNFISQCLLAGGIPMTGQKVRGKGWWYTGESWSYSWAVANAFRWYLSEDRNTMGAVQTDAPDQLMPGDVICYDFEGDGKWNHSTMVTEKDAYGMPLVNARTVSSRHRYWSYEDSYAYTDKTAYRFFHIAKRHPLS